MNKEEKVENLLDVPLNFDDISNIQKFIQDTESSLYGGKNVDGETVNVMVEKGVGMSVRTYQLNNWIRLDEYDVNGIKELETYEGRWQ